MFNGFSQEALDFLFNIRINNNKEWFEKNKKIYTDLIYEPLKALGEIIYQPFANTDMMYKVGRIYRDANFPPYLHYRDTLWIYVRYPAWYWNRTPSLYFELSPEGAEYGFRISKPEAAVMERFRSAVSCEDSNFPALVSELESKGLSVGGEEYKRGKKCPKPELERFYKKKGLSLFKKAAGEEIFTPKLAENIISVFNMVQPVNEMFHEIVETEEISKALLKEAAETEPEPDIVKAPRQDFMW